MSAAEVAADALAAEEALVERKKMLAGEAYVSGADEWRALSELMRLVLTGRYDAMKDQGLLEGRLKARKLLHASLFLRAKSRRACPLRSRVELLQAYNHYPPPAYFKGMAGPEYFGAWSVWMLTIWRSALTR
jgi:maltose O-acetyltransferase